MKKEISTTAAPGAIGPYSQGVKTGNLIFVSGQLPIDAKTGNMPSTIKEQTHQSLENIRHILEAEGASMNNVVKSTVLLADMSLFAEMNEVYAQFFTHPFPARAAFAVKELPKQALIEIELIAAL